MGGGTHRWPDEVLILADRKLAASFFSVRFSLEISSPIAAQARSVGHCFGRRAQRYPSMQRMRRLANPDKLPGYLERELPTNADCECFTLAVPASNPVVGSQVNGYATAIPTPVAYGVGAVTTTCSPSMLRTDPMNPIVVVGGAPTVVNPTLSFADCL